MSNHPKVRNEHQKAFVKMFDGLCYARARWRVWQDFVEMTAIAFANSAKGHYREEREEEYRSISSKYQKSEIEVMSRMICEIASAMSDNPDQDFLGELFMALNFGNEWRGQFFTPYDICRMSARLILEGNIKDQIEEHGWISVADPACGAGALLIAIANEARRSNISHQTQCFFVAQDIDYLAAMMCYIQLSLMGVAGYVVVGDTLSSPEKSIDRRGLIPVDGPNVWYTPVYHSNLWQSRIALERILGGDK